MRGENARLVTSGGWGQTVPPAFAYDLTKGELYKRAKSEGLVRYGRAPSSSDDDTRPLGLSYRIEWAITATGTEVSPLVNSAPLTPLGNPFSSDGDVMGLEQTDSSANNAVFYRGLDVRRNGAWSLWAYLHTPPKGQVIKLHQWFCGSPGAGYVFQIRAGTAEIAGLSPDYNTGEMQQLRVLWGIKKPTDAEEAQIQTLKSKLFVDFESLSFEKSTGRGEWVGNEFQISFIPEARGVLHIVLEGLDATAHEVKSITRTRKAGTINTRSPVTLYSGGGAFFFTLGYPRFRAKAKMAFGPFKNGYFAEHLGALATNINASVGAGQTVTMTKTDVDEVHFDFEVNIVNPDPSTTPWIHAISARLAPGERQAVEDQIVFDTDVPYVPANPAAPRYDGPLILDIVPSWDGALNRRTATVTMIDMFGAASMGKPRPNNRVATLSIGGEAFITDGLITSVRRTDASNLGDDLIPRNILRAESEMVVTLADGWQILNETECEPPPIGDGKTLGAHLREFLALAGFSATQMAGVSAMDGKRIARAAFGEDWAARVESETMCGDAMRALLESYGLGWMFYQDGDGVWHLTRPSTLTGDGFSSSRTPDVHDESGRKTILKPIDITYDTSDFFNHFVVTGGERGELVGEWTDWESIKKPLSPKFIGRRKAKRLRNSGLRTQDDVDYALRSLRWRYGRGGRRAEFESFFHRRFLAGQRVPHDGKLWEIEGLSGGSWAKDQSRFSVFEVLQ